MQFSRVLCSLTLAACACAADTAVWKIAPPPPVSWQRDRVADLAARRKAVMEQIGDHAVLILYAAEPRNYANDVDWPFRQENDFFYLTGLTRPGATLVLVPGAGKIREMVFLPRSNAAQETWTGHMITASEDRETSGVEDVFETGQFIGKLASVGSGVPIKDATTLFNNLRRVKSQREIDILQHAVDITAEAFQRAWAVAAPGKPEYEIQAQFEFTFLRRNGHWGYPCIVGSGNNATTLHYQSNKDTMKAGDLLLIDDAAEFDQYSADVTRTIPVSGKSSQQQPPIYRLVWETHQAGFTMAKPGHAASGGPDSIQGAAGEVFKQGLFKLGLITDPKSDAEMRIWFNHGISHGIGLNVHDPGGSELQPGMVITVEPGLYFRPDALENLPKTPEMEKFAAAIRPVFEKYECILV